ncbi:MAG: TIGR01906 family membrane protein [Bacillota bacterium]
MKTLVAVLLAVCTLLFSAALGLAVIHVTGFPFTVDVDYLDITGTSGLTRTEIFENYDAVMAYLSPLSSADLALPTLGWTEVSTGHFADVKYVFNALYLLGAVSALILLLLTKCRAATREVLRLSGGLTLLVPAIIGGAVAVQFDRAFELFHAIFFAGDTWLLDPQKDEIIKILPSTFFLHCALFIAAFWVIAAAIQFARAYTGKNKY